LKSTVVLVNDGPFAGKLAVITEIVDHNRAMIDGPSTGVPRQTIAYRKVVLTPFVVSGLPRAAGSGAVKKFFEKQEIAAKWEKSAWAQKRAAVEKKRSLNDFDRFKVMLLKKQRRHTLQTTLAKIKKASA